MADARTEDGLGGATLTGGGRPASTTEVITGPPAAIGRYEITGRLGSGGMGVVYEGEDPKLERAVAVKVLAPAPSANTERRQQRMLAEARSLAQLSHPNVVKVFDVGLHEGGVFIAMERLRGETIDAWVERERPSWREIIAVLVEAGAGLVAAHAAGIVHRDFKPLNVMLTEGARQVVVLEMGDSELERTGVVASSSLDDGATMGFVGTPGYASPEQIGRRPVDARADVFGFCATAYELLTGELPFEGASGWEYLAATVEGRMRPLPEDTRVPRRVLEALRRGLRPDPSERLPDMGAVLAALRPSSRPRSMLAAGALVLAAVGVCVGVWSSASDPACAQLRALSSEAWNDARRSGLQQHLDDQIVDERTYSQTVVTSFDDAMGRWHSAVDALCIDASRLRPVPDGRRDCLEQWLGELDGVATFVEGDESAADHALQGIEGVFPVAWCETASGVARSTPTSTETAGDIGRRLQEAATAIRLEQLEAGVLLVREVLADAPRGSVAHIRGQLILAGGLDGLRRHEEAVELFEAAYWDATSHGMDQLAALSAVKAASELAYRLEDLGRAAIWERHAEAAIARAAPTGLNAAEVGLHWAVLDIKAERYESALTRSHESAEQYAAFGQVHGKLTARVFEIEALIGLGRLEQARVVARRGIADAEAVLGSDSGMAEKLRAELRRASEGD